MNSTFEGRPAVASGAFEAKQVFDVDAFVARYGGTTRCAFKTAEQLFVQAEPSSRLFYIQEGQVQLTVVSAQGKEAILSILGPGDFCGESCLVAGRVRSATATCLADSVIAKFDRASSHSRHSAGRGICRVFPRSCPVSRLWTERKPAQPLV